MKIRFASIFAVLLFLCACEKSKKENLNPELEIDIVTGINMRDANGQAISAVGNSNIKTDDIRIFPNPLIDKANVFTLNKTLTQIWILKGTKTEEFKNTDFSEALADHSVSIDMISDKKIMEFGLPGDGANAVSLNFSNLETGYYRIFYQTKSGEIFWDNIFIDKETPQQDLLINLIDDWK